ncbi:MAG: hypothetical protein WC358_06900 [Ignavibacteria bacterium]|jgi:uncharacterized protein YdaL
MYSITSKEIKNGWRYVWDCLVEAVRDDAELEELLDKYEGLPDSNYIKLVNCLVQHFFSEDAIRLVSMWGFGDTPARDQICLDLEAKKDQLKPYLKKYLR